MGHLHMSFFLSHSKYVITFDILSLAMILHCNNLRLISEKWALPHSSVVICLQHKRRAIPGSGKPPGGENGNPLQYSCLGNPMERGAWRATVQGVTRVKTQLSD